MEERKWSLLKMVIKQYMDIVMGARFSNDKVPKYMEIVPVELLQTTARDLPSQIPAGETVKGGDGQ